MSIDKTFNPLELWFITGSQHLYGDETLKQVATHSTIISRALNENKNVPVRIINKQVVTSDSQIYHILQQANVSENCIGIVAWMHTFSPAKMWIKGLQALDKPLLHLHTQFNSEIPWDKIDMDFMNLNQSAHGGREFGFMMSRLRKNRKVIVGHWQEEDVLKHIGQWCRVTAGWHAFRNMKIARIGDNMRDVAVTEGDKVEAQMRFGFSVNGYGLGDLTRFTEAVSESEINQLVQVYKEQYTLKNVKNEQSLRDAAKIEQGLRSFLADGSFSAFTDTFENLHGLKQLPGIAVQRLMGEGYGFGAEGDWKTAALLRAVKVMDRDLPGGSSFMEDYTYHFQGNNSSVLGAHMLEICPSIAEGKPSCEVHPLGIGGKEDPVRLIFNVASGPAVNVSLMDMGNRFRLLLNVVEVLKADQDLPKLPVARVLWKPLPDLRTAAEAWILAGGAHHTVFSKALGSAYFEDFAEMAGVELLSIDNSTVIKNFKNELRWNEIYYHLF